MKLTFPSFTYINLFFFEGKKLEIKVILVTQSHIKEIILRWILNK